MHHDDGGRRTEDGSRTIEYTSFDLPRSVSEGGGTLERYSYGPSGDRVRRIDKDGNSVFYHGDAFELRTNASGTVELGIAHIPGPGGVVASVVMQPDKGVLPIYHHRDALGSAAVTTANAGAVIERPYRDPFGGEVNRSGAPDSNFDTDFLDEGFTGHSLDRATGYIDAEGRMYDPRTRRFLTTDPLAGIGGSQSWDPFSYVRNNPSTLIDPSGFDTIQAQEPPTPNGVGFDTSQTSTSGGGGGSVGGSGGARGTDAPVRIDMTAPNRIVDDGSVTTTRSTGGGDGGLGPAWQTFQNRAFDMMIRGPAAMVTQVYEQTDEDIRKIESRGHDTTVTRYGLVVVNGGVALATSLAHLPEAVDMIAGDVGRAWETGDPKDIAVAAADTAAILGPRGVTNIARGTARGGFRASVAAAAIGLPGTIAALRTLAGRAAGSGPSTMFHYTTSAGRAGILESGVIRASRGARNARHGTGVYFTDIGPEALGATTTRGLMSVGQLSRRLFGVPWNARRLGSFLEIDVGGLGPRQVAPNIWLIVGEGGVNISGRVVRSGATLP